VALSPEARAALDAHGPALVEQWRSEGAEPLTVRQVTERLGNPGWTEATAHNGWLLVRAWLLGWSEVARVGQDYWIPSNSIPKGPEHTRLQVLPIVGVPSPGEEQAGNITRNQPASARRETVPTIDNSPIPQGRETMSNRVSWTYPLRTVHLLEGFIPVPATARSAYPSRGVGEGEREVLRGLWYDDDERLWLWLDRAQDRLYGPDLAHKLEWLEAGDLLRVQWTPDVIVLRLAGHDDEVQREEARLVDLQALKALRGGLGESYRQSLQAILSEKADGLTFVQVVRALRDRQGHDVPRNTMRALLYAGGFVRHNSLWFAAPEGELGERRLRAALAETLMPIEETGQTQTSEVEVITHTEWQGKRVQAIRARVAELVNMLRESL
jgi:hypothetical protein